MKTDFFESPDFNRMLVISVFVHLLFMTLVLFLPKPVFHPKVVIPAFQVNLIELPSSKTNRPTRGDIRSRKKIVAVKPPRQPPVVKQETRRPVRVRQAPPVAAKIVKPPAVPSRSEVARALIHKLDQLNGKTSRIAEPPANPLLRELDQLAQLAPPAAKQTAVKKKKRLANKAIKELRALKNKKALLPPPKPRKLKKPAIVEETLDELKRQSEMLKQNKIQPQKPEPPQTIASENLLRELEELNVRREPEAESRTKKNPDAAQEKTEREKMKFAKLSGTAAREEKAGKRSMAELLAELEALPGVAVKPESFPRPASENKPPPGAVENQEQAFAPILKKLAALEQPGKSMEIQIDKPAMEDFTSIIHKRKRQSPRKAQQQTPEGKPGQTEQRDRDIAAPANDKIATDLLSLYVGIIQKMVFAHWKSPLGAEYNDVVEVSFYLYPKGNIDKPTLIKKSPEEQLNTLAVRAVYDSEPFPRFPADLKASNLHVKIKFKYKPADE
ncbi:MAG: TonB C-terminal domain-containing protein [Nitrospinales bacterium]